MRVRVYCGWRVKLRLLRGRRATWQAEAQKGDVARGFVTPSHRAAWRGLLRMLDEVDGRDSRPRPPTSDQRSASSATPCTSSTPSSGIP